MPAPHRLTSLLAIAHPIVQGPFGGGLSSIALASAVSNAGGLGSFGAHHLAPGAITTLVHNLRAATTRSFAVNLWVPQPDEHDPIPDLTEHIARLAPLYQRLSPKTTGQLPTPPNLTNQTNALPTPTPPNLGDQIDILPAATPPNFSGRTDALLAATPPDNAGRTGDAVLAATSLNFADQIYALLAAGPPNYGEQIDALLAAAPPVISFVMGIPSPDVLDTARSKGIITIGTATTVEEAVAIERAGMDVVVASGSDAGGHRGAFLRPVDESLVGTFSLVPQVADAVTIPVIAAGGIADRRGVRAALALGADGVQVGTAFLATDESGANPAHKRALRSEAAKVTILTRLFSGRTARGIPNALTRELAEHERHVPRYPVQSTLTQPLRTAAAEQGHADLLALWSGQSAALAKGHDAQAVLAELLAGLPRP